MVIEFIAYPLSGTMVPKDQLIEIDVDHKIERNELWVILLLGEGVCALASAPIAAKTDWDTD